MKYIRVLLCLTVCCSLTACAKSGSNNGYEELTLSDELVAETVEESEVREYVFESANETKGFVGDIFADDIGASLASVKARKMSSNRELPTEQFSEISETETSSEIEHTEATEAESVETFETFTYPNESTADEEEKSSSDELEVDSDEFYKGVSKALVDLIKKNAGDEIGLVANKTADEAKALFEQPLPVLTSIDFKQEDVVASDGGLYVEYSADNDVKMLVCSLVKVNESYTVDDALPTKIDEVEVNYATYGNGCFGASWDINDVHNVVYMTATNEIKFKEITGELISLTISS